MKTILVLGAGRSSIYLIEYLLEHSSGLNAKIVVADVDEALAKLKIGEHPSGVAKHINTNDSTSLSDLVESSDFVVSMLPANLHVVVCTLCIQFGISMATASYASSEIKALHDQAIQSGITIMMECGLDPGLDHMSAMKIIDEIKEEGGTLTSFQSFCGGIPAPESDDNPFHYKISWAPRNVVLAGQGGDSVYRKNAQEIRIPYLQLFDAAEKIDIPNWKTLEFYPNRDSLPYEDLYGIQGIPTLLRGTLRYDGFCRFWQELILLGYTDDALDISRVEPKNYASLTAYLRQQRQQKRHNSASSFLLESPEALIWLGLFEEISLPESVKSPAQALQHLLESKLMMQNSDQDLVVMHHELEYILEEKNYKRQSTLILKGENSQRTIMAKTVGLPLAIVVKRMVEGHSFGLGIQWPTSRFVYLPVLKELEEYGVFFDDKILTI